jgi:site-specific DNA recombinase
VTKLQVSVIVDREWNDLLQRCTSIQQRKQPMTIHIYLRRSKNDEGKQQFSLDVQRGGCRDFIARLALGAHPVVEYVDDGKAGDDFHSRAGIRQLIDDAKPGDVIVCRDQSRLGRDAIEVTLVVRDLVRDRGCRLFYYVTGQEVQFANAIDQATTFIQGTGHQMELEAIRSRTREALRSRVREGRIAGGRCYGYQLDRRTDSSGRKYTVAVVDEAQAQVLRRIYREYLAGKGLKGIARALNREGVPSPTVGRRGSGSWSPGGIRPMLMNARYRGVYIHGREKKVRRTGSVQRVKADPSEVLVVEVPEWRIIEDEVWFAVQERFSKRTRVEGLRDALAARYALTGIAKCGECGGAIGCAKTKRRNEVVKAYACMRHRERGGAVCPVTVLQPMDEVEAALVEAIEREILSGPVLETVFGEIRQEIDKQLGWRQVDAAPLEAELAVVSAEQRRLAKAVALADDVPELVAELKQRSARIQYLKAQIEAARRTPDDVVMLINKVEANCRDQVRNLHLALSDPGDLRMVLLALFPDGLVFTPEWINEEVPRRRQFGYPVVRPDSGVTRSPLFRVQKRRIWRAKGLMRLGSSDCVATPTGFEPVSPA